MAGRRRRRLCQITAGMSSNRSKKYGEANRNISAQIGNGDIKSGCTRLSPLDSRIEPLVLSLKIKVLS
jgi:hypothetical protein